MKNIYKSILRGFMRRPVINLINLTGLSVSLALVIILSLYCYSELTTDHFQRNADRIYIFGNIERVYTPGVLKDHIDSDVPEIEYSTRISGTWGPPVFRTDDHQPFESDLVFADDDFFRIFTYKFIEGNPETALKDPLTIVITSDLANKLFGKEDPLGKKIKFNNADILTVSGVIDRPDANSCLSFSSISNIATRKILMANDGEFTEWGWCDFQTFVLLNKGSDPSKTGRAIRSLFPDTEKESWKNVGLTPLKKIYFSGFTLFGDNYLRSGDRKKVEILLLVAALVMIIAIINFVNISSSRWDENIRQTGVLKVIGASRFSIVGRAIADSFAYFLVSLLVAIELVNLLKEPVSNYTGIEFNLGIVNSGIFLVLSVLAVGLLSTLFSLASAIRVSTTKAIDNLKKATVKGKRSSAFSDTLVTIQIAISIALISFGLLVQKQVKFGSTKLGFNQKNIITIGLTAQLSEKKEALRDYLLGLPGVKDISFSQYFPGKTMSYWEREFRITGEKKVIDFDTFSADAEFFKMLGLQLVSGRLYSDSLVSDRKKIIVNEAFIRENNISDPVGTILVTDQPGPVPEIIGVVKDFHYKPVNEPIIPLAIRNDSFASYCMITAETKNYKSLVKIFDNIRQGASSLSPSFPVEVSFLDNAVQKMYQSEIKFRHAFSLFSGSAIIICSLGLLALSIFASQRRIKEIGIRKVNGAKISEIMIMLNNDLVKWVVVAFLTACPIAWFAMKSWLGNFAYKTGISWWIFALAGIIAIVIALATVSWQSWRAAKGNPVEALRYE